MLSQISGGQHGKADYASPQGWKTWPNVSSLQQSLPVTSEKK